MKRFALLITSLLLSTQALALSLSELTQQDTATAMKDALTQGAQLAVSELGKPGGFSNNPDVRIELPGKLGSAARTLKMMGMGSQITALENSMNQAAEAAVPQAQSILVNAISRMSLTDAKGVLTGGNDSATQYLERSSREEIRALFLPVVKQATDQIGVAQQYNTFASQAAGFGVVDANATSVESYVTEKALDSLFEMIAQQEATIRSDPTAAASNLARKVFGAL
ncbi:DUF4197 domain-containing protein [Halopseudomonas oceani]|uniref:DUF4197 domain-containing protein n=1 Tax=Halopseudomonas oceani TaxID=1708783 RepID=UPI002AA602BA|nr:DUF4197 domain-containing protein [Halopseudomonas oceani]